MKGRRRIAAVVAASVVTVLVGGAAAEAAGEDPNANCMSRTTTIDVSAAVSEFGYNSWLDPAGGPGHVDTPVYYRGPAAVDKSSITITVCKVGMGTPSIRDGSVMIESVHRDLDITTRGSDQQVTMKPTGGQRSGYGVFVQEVSSSAIYLDVVKCLPSPRPLSDFAPLGARGVLAIIGRLPSPAVKVGTKLASFFLPSTPEGQFYCASMGTVKFPIDISSGEARLAGSPKNGVGWTASEQSLPCVSGRMDCRLITRNEVMLSATARTVLGSGGAGGGSTGSSGSASGGSSRTPVIPANGIVRTPEGTIWVLAGGAKYAMSWPEYVAIGSPAYTSLPASMIETYGSMPRTNTFLRNPSTGSIYQVVDGTKYGLSWVEYQALGTPAYVNVPQGFIDRVNGTTPRGPMFLRNPVNGSIFQVVNGAKYGLSMVEYQALGTPAYVNVPQGLIDRATAVAPQGEWFLRDTTQTIYQVVGGAKFALAYPEWAALGSPGYVAVPTGFTARITATVPSGTMHLRDDAGNIFRVLGGYKTYLSFDAWAAAGYPDYVQVPTRWLDGIPTGKVESASSRVFR